MRREPSKLPTGVRGIMLHAGRPRPSARVVALSLSILMLFPAATLVSPARADSATVVQTGMTGGTGTSAVWNGQYAFIFGGISLSDGSFKDHILRYDPATNGITTMAAKLPTPRAYTSAVLMGAEIYLFGGLNGLSQSAQILRYSPATDTLQVMPHTLPTVRYGTAAVAFGGSAYVIGGSSGASQIVRYTPGSAPVVVTSSLVPGRSDASAFYDGSSIHILGGLQEGAGARLDLITLYNPTSNAFTASTAKLPTPRDSMGLAWNGQHAYLFGGFACSPACTATDQIVRYEPATKVLTVMAAKLPLARDQASAVWAGPDAYAFGGNCIPCNDVIRYRGVPGAPRDVTAAPGSGVGQLTVTWQPPPSNSYTDGVTRYDVYHANSLGGTYTWRMYTTSSLTFTEGGMGNGQTRCYKVTATNAVGEGPHSTPVATEHCATTFDKPGAPQAVTATAGPGVGEIKVQWQAPLSDGGSPVTEYRVYRAASNGGTFTYRGLTNAAREFVDGGLGNGERWCYKVSAKNVVGEGPLGQAGADTNCATTFTAPQPPQAVTADAGPGPGNLTVRWQAPLSNGGTPVTGYTVFRAPSAAGAYVQVGGVAQTVHEWLDTGRGTGATWCYKVTATNAAGTSGPSEPSAAEHCARTFATPGAPSSLAARRGPGEGQIRLDWQPPLDDGGLPVKQYVVYRSITADGTYSLIQTLGDVRTYTDAGLGQGTFRCYKVGAASDAGEGAASAHACATTPTVPGAPRNLTAGPGPGRVILLWDAPEDDGGSAIERYRVHRRTSATGAYSFIAETPPTERFHEDATCPAGVTCQYVVTAFNALGEGPQSNQASFAGTAVSIYEETFDTGTAKFAAIEGLWHLSDCRSVSPTYSLGYNRATLGCTAATGGPPNYSTGGRTEGVAVTLPFTLPASKDSRLTFASWFDTEPGCSPDVKRVLIRESDPTGIATGAWQELVSPCERGSQLPLTFIEVQRIWYGRILPIPSAWNGKIIQVGFAFDSNDAAANHGEGWYVDNVRVVASA